MTETSPYSHLDSEELSQTQQFVIGVLTKVEGRAELWENALYLELGKLCYEAYRRDN